MGPRNDCHSRGRLGLVGYLYIGPNGCGCVWAFTSALKLYAVLEGRGQVFYSRTGEL